MKKTCLLILITIFGMVPVCMGKVSIRVCLADDNAPPEPDWVNLSIIEYPDIWVGTKLTIIAWSDVAEEWYGGALFLEKADMNTVGYLYGRCCEEFECPCSCLPDAGTNAAVYESYMYPRPAFELYGGSEPNAGDWFIFDYNALDIGDCNVVFYDDFDVNKVQIHTFHHVRTRDWIKDNIVNFADFAVLASYWDVNNCGDINNCGGTDLDIDGRVDMNDLRLFTDYWLYEIKFPQ